jgi:DnaJ-class molecular chaperone
MAGSECLYDLLGVADDATDDELKRAYRESARRHHPDVNPGAEPGKFSRISSAYDVLRDSTKRRAYDASRAWQAGTDTGSTGSDKSQRVGRVRGVRPGVRGAVPLRPSHRD